MGVILIASNGAGLGTSPPTPAIGGGSNDERGTVNFGSGTSPAAGALVALTSGASRNGVGTGSPTSLGVALCPLNAATAALGPFYATWDTAGRVLTVSGTNAPTASQAATTYSLSYTITG